MPDLPAPVEESKRTAIKRGLFKTYLKRYHCWSKFFLKKKAYRKQGYSAREAYIRALADMGLDWQKPPVISDAEVIRAGEYIDPDIPGMDELKGKSKSRPRGKTRTPDKPPPYIPEEEMASGAVWAGKPKDIDARKVVQWVFENMGVVDVKPEDAPCGGAWSLLMELRKDAVMRSDFYRSTWPKLLPAKSQVDIEANIRDDNRVLEQVDNVLKAILEKKA